MDRIDLARWRMHAQHLWGEPLDDPEAVLTAFGAMQAQEFVPALWSLAQRSSGVTHAAMLAAFDEGALLRTHVVRPTWHFVHPTDIRWVLDATRERVEQLNAHQYRVLELDEATLTQAEDLLASALVGGVRATRAELREHLSSHGLDAVGLRAGYMVMRAELDAVIVSGALRGRTQTYAAFADRVPPDGMPRAPLDVLAQISRRYFASRGPATVRDFACWSSLTLTKAREGLEMVANGLDSLDVDGRTYWFGVGPPEAPPPSPRVDLVQCYDECVMSYSESKDVLFPTALEGVSRADLYEPHFLHTILLDGQLVGHWKHAVRPGRVEVDVWFYREPTVRQRSAMDDAVERLGAYFELPAEWRVGS